MLGGAKAVLVDRYPEMDWQAVDEVAMWCNFRKKMTIIFITEGTPKETQYAKVLVARGDEAFNSWHTLEPHVKEPDKNIDAFWDAFEKSFEETTTHWHFIDQYLRDFRQDPEEFRADLDLCTRELVKGCKFPEDQVERHLLELLYHATNLFEIHKYIVDTPDARYDYCIERAKQHERTCADFKDHASYCGATAGNIPLCSNPLITAHAVQ